jgi:hypothetical protein
MTPLRIITNFIIGAEAYPMRNRPILPGLLGQDLLGPEGFLGRHGGEKRHTEEGLCNVLCEQYRAREG